MTVPLSILDLAIIDEGESARDSFASSLALAREAEKLGYTRIWYAEHHNMPTIASSATSVLIGYIAAHTESIRLGAGGVMLPNHAPLTIAEQFGTLETLFPGRIDLGLGRAPGSDQKTMRALRRDPMSSDSFPQDVQELQGYLTGNTLIPGIHATPGTGTNVPLYILGSSLFGAKLAAALGLPYSFASHFAPQALQDAVTIYRRDFKPSAQLAEPYVIAGVNVVAAETSEEAQQMFADSQRRRVTQLFGRDRTFTDEEADAILQSPGGQQVKQMGRYSAVGNPEEVRDYLDWFTGHAQADELIVATQTATLESRLRSFQLLAEAAALPVSA
ncbi:MULTISPECIES: LLM class flavin-dependent oxidoreductase [unclassified Arthrobacter]|uniref:LLM class flavin-dependent oxidoreductase n=1 Tax=unclassified Arthrobacter TaxID=235627 RepID=UPI001D14DE20|nr:MULTISPECIES: LLM class flavin-dependent oxidoreductase [unclassified Arthrobacter]MCC3277383.1 LLM class flavin-dependent oxidoreductase [Arthrobacter sp. zg-Y20]MCC3280018.1 LLM class flavin-dependent oxidoreductase [Arthrobacter sp. zg-Y40]MCC9178235.1 LLM class flavin-dependent oxidoreductase [Arthrobacter sp. zg-Y750]MDK1317543.1 LLM class flavin-dependent oxidoreductase [Arthrobacter sp. zg.Y20]MDK1328368.1 LLM class flavin-dependent oxidoreductase [Arthrobacter sp. zg-Y1143]